MGFSLVTAGELPSYPLVPLWPCHSSPTATSTAWQALVCPQDPSTHSDCHYGYGLHATPDSTKPCSGEYIRTAWATHKCHVPHVASLKLVWPMSPPRPFWLRSLSLSLSLSLGTRALVLVLVLVLVPVPFLAFGCWSAFLEGGGGGGGKEPWMGA